MPRLDPRHRIMVAARNDFQDAMWKIMKDHGLTYNELFYVMSEGLNVATHEAIRVERGEGKEWDDE